MLKRLMSSLEQAGGVLPNHWKASHASHGTLGRSHTEPQFRSKAAPSKQPAEVLLLLTGAGPNSCTSHLISCKTGEHPCFLG